MNILSTDREQRLLKRFDGGEASAMDELYAQYADSLAGVAFRYLGNDDDVKDVLQEAFIKIFTQIGSFTYRGKGSLKAWLTRIVINEALMFIRNRKRESMVDIDVGDASEVLAGEEEEPPQQSGQLDNVPVMELIAKLPTGYRLVFNLFVIDGLSHKQIAEQLGITPGTSASQYHKARQMLKRMINDYRRQHDD